MSQQFNGAAIVGADGAFGGIPIHVREVVILGIFFVGDQGGENVPALLYGGAQEAGGEVKADDGGGIVFGEGGEFFERGVAGVFVFAEELDGELSADEIADLKEWT